MNRGERDPRVGGVGDSEAPAIYEPQSARRQRALNKALVPQVEQLSDISPNIPHASHIPRWWGAECRIILNSKLGLRALDYLNEALKHLLADVLF